MSLLRYSIEIGLMSTRRLGYFNILLLGLIRPGGMGQLDKA